MGKPEVRIDSRNLMAVSDSFDRNSNRRGATREILRARAAEVTLSNVKSYLGDTQKQVSQLPVRHCERSEAIHGPQYDRLGCWRRACCGPWIASS